MNLKTSLKTVISTLFELKLPVLGLLMLLFCITACNQHEVLSPTNTSTVSLEERNFSEEEADFFRNRTVDEFANLRIDNLNEGSSNNRISFNRSVNRMKNYIRNLNGQMESKYIPHIVQNIGYPLWSASYIVDAEGGGTITFVPLLQSNGRNVNGIISYYSSGEVGSYSLTTRHQITTAVEDAYDRNYNFITHIFHKFDRELLEYEGEEYSEWERRINWNGVGQLGEDCYQQLTCLDITNPNTCYVVCSSGCTNDIYAADIVDFAEAIWLNGNCAYGAVIDGFLEDNDASDVAVTEAGQVLMDIGIAGVLNFSELKGLANALDALFDDADNDENIADLLEYFDNNGLDFFTLDAFGISNGTNLTPSLAPAGNWMDMRSGDFWAFTTGIYNGLVADYPSQEDRIDNWFSCRILGPAQEDACLTSLGLELNNSLPAGFNRRPDGYIQRPIFDGWTAYQQPFFIEVKGKYGNSAPTEFDYMTPSGNFSPQFTDYLWYLNTNTHLPNCTAYHGLFMILPANVALADIVVDACSAYNVPLYRSGIEYNVDNQSEVRVQSPELLNIDGLFYTCYAFNFVRDYIMESALEHHMWLWFNYDAAIIPFAQKAQDFETSYLIPNVEPDPDPDECEGE